MELLLNKLERQLLDIMADGRNYSAQSLANSLGVSGKTVRNRLNNLADMIAPLGFRITS